VASFGNRETMAKIYQTLFKMGLIYLFKFAKNATAGATAGVTAFYKLS
jgi:hypothetical protein